MPLVIAAVDSGEIRRSLGTAIFFGMLGATLFGRAFTPVFYVVVRRVADRLRRKPAAVGGAGAEAS